MKWTLNDLKNAANKNIISENQLKELLIIHQEIYKNKPQLNFLSVIYYFGALLVIGAMGWFMTLGIEKLNSISIFLIASFYAILFYFAGYMLWFKKDFKIIGGLLYTMGVCMTPLIIYGLQKTYGLWLFGNPGVYQNFYLWIKGGWFFIELGTIIAGLITIRFVPFAFISAPIAFCLWFMSMDITPILFKTDYNNWFYKEILSIFFGLGMIIFSYLIDKKTKADYSFWLYIFGTLTFCGGLSLLFYDGNKINQFLYFLINIGLILISVFLKRYVFLIFGVLGVYSFLTYLSYSVFKQSLLFPFILSFIGLGTLSIGYLYQKNKQKLRIIFSKYTPNWVINLRP